LEGTLLYTTHQTEGKGQRGNTWLAEKNKNLTFSILLTPSFLLPRHQFQISVMVAVGLRNALATLLPNKTVAIKWPNDILVNDTKIAGVLIENTVTHQKISSSIVGIGVNVNQIQFSIDRPVTSLALEKGAEFNVEETLNHITRSLDAAYLRLRNGGFDALLKQYYQFLFKFQEPSIFQDAKGYLFTGTINAITEAGLLEMQTENGLQVFDIKEITFV
jgi:BirA family biotin operon repressor/biotin-[acetyl-CoA-carboxylase] ligase